MTLYLVDGSRIIGVWNVKSVSAQTRYGRINIALEQIVSIEMEDDRETASFQLKGGDKLRGILDVQVSARVPHICSPCDWLACWTRPRER